MPFFSNSFSSSRNSNILLSKIKGIAKASGLRESDILDFRGLEEFNYGVNIGGGIKVAEMALEIRYQNGLTQVLTQEGSEGLKLKADVISFNLLIHLY